MPNGIIKTKDEDIILKDHGILEEPDILLLLLLLIQNNQLRFALNLSARSAETLLYFSACVFWYIMPGLPSLRPPLPPISIDRDFKNTTASLNHLKSYCNLSASTSIQIPLRMCCVSYLPVSLSHQQVGTHNT